MKSLKIIQSFAYSLCAFSLLFVTACSTEDEPEVVINPITLSAFSAIDIGNTESSSDIQVKFQLSEGVDAIRLYLVATHSASQLTTDQLSAVPDGAFLEVPGVRATQKEYAFQLPQLLDIDGKALTHDTPYSVVLLYEKEGGSFIAEKKAAITLQDASPILGRYVGRWDDNLFANVPVSFWLKEQNGARISGDFYISNDFRPAYGGEQNDGTITILLAEDGSQTFTFRYSQDLPDYKGGCPGVYTGEGEFAPFSVSISFTGEDCDGTHEEGRISVERSY